MKGFGINLAELFPTVDIDRLFVCVHNIFVFISNIVMYFVLALMIICQLTSKLIQFATINIHSYTSIIYIHSNKYKNVPLTLILHNTIYHVDNSRSDLLSIIRK